MEKNSLDFTTGYWKDVQFRIKTLEELEEFYGKKLTKKQRFFDSKRIQTFVDNMHKFMGQPIEVTEELVLVWMGLQTDVAIKECGYYSFVREWITHNKIDEE